MRLVTRAAATVLALGLPALSPGQTPAPPRLPSPSQLAASHAIIKSRPPDFGTVATTYKQFSAVSFVVLDSTDVFSTSGPYFGKVLRTGAGSTLTPFAVNLDLPDGAVLTYLELDGCDDTGGLGGYVQGTLIAASSFGDVNYAAPFLMSAGTGCGFWDEDITAAGIVINNFVDHYWLLGYTAQATGFTVGFSGMVVGYHLQVPPAPGAPDFGDVPVSSPQFQFVEALYHAGITAGCGGGNYCPDSPVTRGQMAVFLAKALGLL